MGRYGYGSKHLDGLVWVPADVCEAVLNHKYNIPTAGHPGARKMKSALLKSYWWPEMDKDVEQYVTRCQGRVP